MMQVVISESYPRLSDDWSLQTPAIPFIGCERVYETAGREAREQRQFPDMVSKDQSGEITVLFI
jgi:hypothetical protein